MVSAADVVELEVEHVCHATDKALLAEIDGVKYWVPRSVIVDGGDITSDSEPGAAGTVLVQSWWAVERGLE